MFSTSLHAFKERRPEEKNVHYRRLEDKDHPDVMHIPIWASEKLFSGPDSNNRMNAVS